MKKSEAVEMLDLFLSSKEAKLGVAEGNLAERVLDFVEERIGMMPPESARTRVGKSGEDGKGAEDSKGAKAGEDGVMVPVYKWSSEWWLL